MVTKWYIAEYNLAISLTMQPLPYYVCRPKALALLDDTQVNDGAAGKPQWVDIQGLQAQDFQAHGDIILDLCKKVAA